MAVTRMTSDRVFVWAWLPGSTEPTVAGAVDRRGDLLSFVYGRTYLDRSDALSLAPDLPLVRGTQMPESGLEVASSLRDASPDAWGRQVIDFYRAGLLASKDDVGLADERVYMLNSDSNRFGAIDFQRSATEYVPRGASATLDDLASATGFVDEGRDVPESLQRALGHGTTMGGARPKATVTDGDVQYIAKFSRASDPYDVVGAEAAAMFMAQQAGVKVASTKVVRAAGKKVLLVERFDRTTDGRRRFAVSGLTLMGLSEMNARYATYPGLLRRLRDGLAPGDSAPDRELFRRIAFNIAVSNSDDHLRNHAAFWDGGHLQLTPAYDISPMPRSGETSTQALGITDKHAERDSSFALLIESSHHYGLSARAGREIVFEVVEAIHETWGEACAHGEISQLEARRMWGSQILNPRAMFGLDRASLLPGSGERSRSRAAATKSVPAGLCRRETRSGRPCQNPAGSCPHHS